MTFDLGKSRHQTNSKLRAHSARLTCFVNYRLRDTRCTSDRRFRTKMGNSPFNCWPSIKHRLVIGVPITAVNR